MTRIAIGVLHDFASDSTVWRAYQHLFAARDGAVIVVPTTQVWGPFDGVLDGLPIPWTEAVSILSVGHEHGRDLTEGQRARLAAEAIAHVHTYDGHGLRLFVGNVLPADEPWSHQRFALERWGARCRVFLSQHGARVAFVRDWLA